MALPVMGAAALAALSYLSLTSKNPAPVTQPPASRTSMETSTSGGSGGGAGVLAPRIPNKPLLVDRPVVGDRIADPQFAAVASSAAAALGKAEPEVVIGAAADSTSSVAAAFLRGSTKQAPSLPQSRLVDAPAATRRSVFSSSEAREAAELLVGATKRVGKSVKSSSSSKVTTTRTTTTTVVKTKKGDGGGSGYWVEITVLVVVAAIVLAWPRASQKIKKVYKHSTSERSEAQDRKSKAGRGGVVVEEAEPSSGTTRSSGHETAVATEGAGSGAGAGAGAGGDDVSEMYDEALREARRWQTRHAEDTAALKRQLMVVQRELSVAEEQDERWRAIMDDLEAGVAEEGDVAEDADPAALHTRVVKLQRMVRLLKQQLMSGSGGFWVGATEPDAQQLRKKMDDTMALIKGEVITLDWPGIELVSRLLKEMGGGWQVHGEANALKEETFRECHRLLHGMVCDLEGRDLEVGEEWAIANMDDFLDKIERDRYPDVFLTLQRLVVAYDTMSPTAKNDISAREMVLNVATLLEVARFTKYWVTRIHQHRTHYGGRFGSASGTFRSTSSFHSSTQESGREEVIDRIGALAEQGGDASPGSPRTGLRREKRTLAYSEAFTQISAADALGVTASGTYAPDDAAAEPSE